MKLLAAPALALLLMGSGSGTVTTAEAADCRGQIPIPVECSGVDRGRLQHGQIAVRFAISQADWDYIVRHGRDDCWTPYNMTSYGRSKITLWRRSIVVGIDARSYWMFDGPATGRRYCFGNCG
jgi:hypothetical protein